ncbi:Acetyltransferase (GNAT) family protein [Geodermatophilus amargosae]|uniref:Acetyltransferase (GNAT) family protein n=1 Tax=Geodermatophilus amargosae TaxID=1296565 RepID=A0A1I6Z1M2_9ACTN|nr:GNAT family N-acetyltransferase [Geodermatophilus amargosae]SFT56579.1 Acetyltransferase (GNAT) family protein [Geodermatophilus amargosae]
MPSRPGLLDRVEQYAVVASLPDAPPVAAGALAVPIGPPAWPFPARPYPGTRTVPADDVRAAVALQEEAGLPAAVEWVVDRTPSLAAAARAAGLLVTEFPLLVVDDPVELLLPLGVRLYVVGGDDPALPHYQHLLETGFAPHAAEGPGNAGEDPAPPDEARTAVLRERVATGRTVVMVAVEDGTPVAVGSHQPVDVDGTEISEVVGVASSPRRRGRGVGAALASALVAQARETADLVFLTAGDDDVARVYERVGFAWLGSTGVAARPPD